MFPLMEYNASPDDILMLRYKIEIFIILMCSSSSKSCCAIGIVNRTLHLAIDTSD